MQTLPHRNAAFQQERTDLIDDAGTLADQALADAVQRLQVKLVGGLGRHELHGRALHRLGSAARYALHRGVLPPPTFCRSPGAPGPSHYRTFRAPQRLLNRVGRRESHSITALAWARIDGGMVSLSAPAAQRLTGSSRKSALGPRRPEA